MSYAALLRRAVVSPETLTAQDHARLLPTDRALVAKVYDFHIDKATAQLARSHKPAEKNPYGIGKSRWQSILAGFQADEMCITDLSVDELLAIDNDSALREQFEAALDEGWSR